jgi:hypothetical protein
LQAVPLQSRDELAMNAYKHTQIGKLMVIVMAIASLVLIVIGLFVQRPVLAGVPILLLMTWLFYSLTVEVSNGELRWRFGLGLIHKRVPLDQIASAEPIRTSLIDGWGIHWGRFGWLYNVSGFDAVQIKLRSGKKFALGTDEPKVLAEHLQPKGRR